MNQLKFKLRLFRPIVTLVSLFALQAKYCGWEEEAPFKDEIHSQAERSELEAFHKAVGKGDLREVEGYLEKISNYPKKSQEKFLNSVIDGTTPLGKAIEQSHEEMVRGLSRHRYVDINKTGKNVPSLLLALKSKKPKIAEILLTVAKSRNKALNVAASDPDSGNRPLHLAAKEGYVEVINLLLEGKNKVDVNAQNSTNTDTPLHLAVASGRVDVVRALLADENTQVNQRNNQSSAPLHLAVKAGDLSIVQVLLEHEDIDVNEKDWNANTPLHLAVANGRLEIVRALLVKNDIRVNQRNNQSNAPLHLAVVKGYYDVIKAFLESANITDVNIKDKDGNTPLHLAIASGRLEIVQYLVKVKDIDLNAKNNDDMVPMRLAKQYRNLDVIEVFRGAKKTFDMNFFNTHTHSFSEEAIKDYLAQGLDIDAKDRHGRTLLIHSVIYQKKPLIRFLIDQGADVNAQGAFDRIPHGDTALHIAARDGFEEIAAMLLDPKNNIDLNIQNLRQDTALHLAVYNKHVKLVKSLLENKGIDLNLKNIDGDTALSIAKKGGIQAIIEALENYKG